MIALCPQKSSFESDNNLALQKANFHFFTGTIQKMANLPRIVTTFSRGTNVFMVFCGPHLPPASHFVCGLGEAGDRKQNGRQAEGISLFGCAAACGLVVYSTNSSLRWRGPLLETIALLETDGTKSQIFWSSRKKRVPFCWILFIFC